LWRIELDAKADKELGRIGSKDRQRILKFLSQRLARLDNPRAIGEALTGPLSDFWKYGVGDYRIIASIRDSEIVILIVRIGNRREIYR